MWTVVHMNLFQLTCVLQNTGISRNQNARCAGNREEGYFEKMYLSFVYVVKGNTKSISETFQIFFR